MNDERELTLNELDTVAGGAANLEPRSSSD
jgi:hypothetical protein